MVEEGTQVDRPQWMNEKQLQSEVDNLPAVRRDLYTTLDLRAKIGPDGRPVRIPIEQKFSLLDYIKSLDDEQLQIEIERAKNSQRIDSNIPTNPYDIEDVEEWQRETDKYVYTMKGVPDD